MKKRIVVAILFLTLFTSCSLITINNTSTDDYLEVDASTWEECQTTCDSKNRSPFAGILYAKGKVPAFRCACGPVRDTNSSEEK